MVRSSVRSTQAYAVSFLVSWFANDPLIATIFEEPVTAIAEPLFAFFT